MQLPLRKRDLHIIFRRVFRRRRGKLTRCARRRRGQRTVKDWRPEIECDTEQLQRLFLVTRNQIVFFKHRRPLPPRRRRRACEELHEVLVSLALDPRASLQPRRSASAATPSSFSKAHTLLEERFATAATSAAVSFHQNISRRSRTTA